MTFLVYYVDFHADNYQGASGKSFEFTRAINIPDEFNVRDIKSVINEELNRITFEQKPYRVPESKFAIQRIELL